MQIEMRLPPAGGGALLLPVAVGPGEKLYAEFLAGRSPNTLRAYCEDLAALPLGRAP